MDLVFCLCLKPFLIKAYVSVHEMDVICLSEAYLYSFVQTDDNFQIPGYSSVRDLICFYK